MRKILIQLGKGKKQWRFIYCCGKVSLPKTFFSIIFVAFNQELVQESICCVNQNERSAKSRLWDIKLEEDMVLRKERSRYDQVKEIGSWVSDRIIWRWNTHNSFNTTIIKKRRRRICLIFSFFFLFLLINWL